MRWQVPTCFLALILCGAGSGTVLHAQEPTKDPAVAMLDEARQILTDLEQKKAFIMSQHAEELWTQLAVLEYPVKPRYALPTARRLKEPFYASLALGAIAAYSMKTDPEAAAQLLLGAQERALSIDHWNDTDATSLNYLYELIPLFPQERAKQLLKQSRRNLAQWPGDGMQKSKPVLVLAQQTIALDPASAEALLDEAASDEIANTHLYEAIQLLTSHVAMEKPQWAAEQVAAFYKSGKSLPGSYEPLYTLVIEDGVRDPAAAKEKIARMPAQYQEDARFWLALALHRAGKVKEAAMILPSIVDHDAVKVRPVEDLTMVIGPDKIDAMIAGNTLDGLPLDRLFVHMHFRDKQQAAAFLKTATPLAEKITDFLGYPHHGSPRSVALGTLAQLAAILEQPEMAKDLADKIAIPELRAFYLMNAYETLHPMPPIARDWPIRFYHRIQMRIDQAPPKQTPQQSP